MVEDPEQVRTGADLVAEFIAQNCAPGVHLVTGGACAFIVDALARNPTTGYVCFQHEQAAAMAADAVWRVSGKVGVTVATSGPGATNLITGIACSWFDSIPALHITGQVNDSESKVSFGTNVRQGGFQETDIVGIARPITKYAVQVHSGRELVNELREAFRQATSGRMGPVLVDIPMNVQKEVIPRYLWDDALRPISSGALTPSLDWSAISSFFLSAQRPLVLVGGGAALSGTARSVQQWCEAEGIPYVASWSAISSIDRSAPLYRGTIGVYGSPKANWTIQAADRLLTLGSRLDNRQRTGNPQAFAPFAKVLAVDIDEAELQKFSRESNYSTLTANLASWPLACRPLERSDSWREWLQLLSSGDSLQSSGVDEAVGDTDLSPYAAVQHLQALMPPSVVVAADTGANLCWVYQSLLPSDSFVFTAAGNSPMGYSLPAAIGAKFARRDAPVWCFIGDGGLQMNIQELQTVVHYGLDIVIVVLNNQGYGIIKQFQDAYLEGRHEASGAGYSVPSLRGIAEAYGLKYCRVDSLDDIKQSVVTVGPVLIDVMLPPEALITPKVEMDRFMHDQFPYTKTRDLVDLLPYAYPSRPSRLPT